MQSKLIVIRHGITEGNKNKWFYGGEDLPLLKEGKEDLRRVRDEGVYSHIPEDAQYFTTGMRRTEETLEILFGPQPHRAIENMKEMRFGDYECKPFDDLREDPVFLEWGYDTTGDVALPGGESKNEFDARVEKGIKELLKDHALLELKNRHHGGPAVTVLICHGGVISSIMAQMFPGEQHSIWDWMVEPGSGYEIEFTEGKPTGYTLRGIQSFDLVDKEELEAIENDER